MLYPINGAQVLNPFMGKNFYIASAVEKIKYTKGLVVTFNENFITYKLCKLNHGRYVVRSSNRFDVAFWSGLPLWTCQNVIDTNISSTFL